MRWWSGDGDYDAEMIQDDINVRTLQLHGISRDSSKQERGDRRVISINQSNTSIMTNVIINGLK